MRLNLYDCLCVPRSANLATLRSAYRHAALITHPDKGGTSSSFLATVEAFETLSDPDRRAAYDRQLEVRGLRDGLGIPRSPPAAVAPAPASGGAPAASSNEAAQAAPATAGRCKKAQRSRPRSATPNSSNPDDGGSEAGSLWEVFVACADEEALRRRVGELSYWSLEALLAWRKALRSRRAAQRGKSTPTGQGRRPGRAGKSSRAEAKVLALGDNEPQQAPPGTGVVQRGVTRRLHKRHPAEQHVTTSRGVFCAHGKSQQDYVAAVGWSSFLVTTRSTRSVAEAVDWHIDLVNIKQLAKRRIREGWDFGEAVKATVAETLAAREAEGKDSLLLRFASSMSCQGHKISLPLSELAAALEQRLEIMALRASGASFADIVAVKDRFVSAARERRRLQFAMHKAARKAAQKAARKAAEARRLAETAQKAARQRAGTRSTLRLERLVKEQLRIIRKRLGVQRLDQGVDAVQLHDGPFPEVLAYAELSTSLPNAGDATRRPLCTGPLRSSIAEAAADRDMLCRIRRDRGDEVACAEARRLDLEAMTARFMSVTS